MKKKNIGIPFLEKIKSKEDRDSHWNNNGRHK